MGSLAQPTLIFAHYFGGSARSWSPLLSALAGDADCSAPDLAGFGGSEAPEVVSLDSYIDQMEALAGERPWIAVGHSMGGKIAMAAAARRSAALKALILIAPSPPTGEPTSEAERQDTIDAFADRAAAQRLFEKITDDSLFADVFAVCVEDELRVAPRARLWWLKRGSREDISDRTRGLDLPVLVIAGDDDKVFGLKTPFKVANGLKRAEVSVVAGGGHLVPLEQPALVADMIRTFLSDLQSTGCDA